MPKKITIKGGELFDEATSTFINCDDRTVVLEHSLVSISKWEAKWKKPFLTNKEKTNDEILDYIKCMNLTQNVPDTQWLFLSKANIREIKAYIEDPMTATTFSDDKKARPSREVITSELIYYWMTTYQIPVEFQKWHINRLLTLIKVCNIKNAPPKKMSKRDIMSRNKALNEARRQKLGTNG